VQENDSYPDPFFFRHNHFTGALVRMNPDCLFRGKNGAIITDLTQEKFAKVLASLGRPLTQTFFGRSYNLENARIRI